MKKGGVFCFAISALISEIFKFLHIAKLKIDDVISSYSMERKSQNEEYL